MNNIPKFDLPYYEALFIIEYNEDLEGMAEMYSKMVEIVKQQSGFLDMIESSTVEGCEILICFWKDLESIKAWGKNFEHQIAIEKGKTHWFKSYKVLISKVEFALGF